MTLNNACQTCSSHTHPPVKTQPGLRGWMVDGWFEIIFFYYIKLWRTNNYNTKSLIFSSFLFSVFFLWALFNLLSHFQSEISSYLAQSASDQQWENLLNLNLKRWGLITWRSNYLAVWAPGRCSSSALGCGQLYFSAPLCPFEGISPAVLRKVLNPWTFLFTLTNHRNVSCDLY